MQYWLPTVPIGMFPHARRFSKRIRHAIRQSPVATVAELAPAYNRIAMEYEASTCAGMNILCCQGLPHALISLFFKYQFYNSINHAMSHRVDFAEKHKIFFLA